MLRRATVAAVLVGSVYASDLTGLASASAASVDAPRVGELLTEVQRAWTLRLRSGRYMEQSCSPSAAPHGGWEGYPVQVCDYSSKGVAAKVYMLNPSVEQLARWTVSACLDAAAINLPGCTRYLIQETWNASNGQFPVAGYVVEPRSSAGGSGNDPICLYFRDGVTAGTRSSSNEVRGGRCGPDTANAEAPDRARVFARISSTTRAMYRAAGGVQPVGVDGDVRWLRVVADAYKEAWKSDRNFLMFAKAKYGKSAGAFR